MIQEDVKHGFALPLPVEVLSHIPNASLAPLECHEQMTINTLGERVTKCHLTHDQSFSWPSGSSVNLRLIPPNYLPLCMVSVSHVSYIIYWDYINAIHPQRFL